MSNTVNLNELRVQPCQFCKSQACKLVIDDAMVDMGHGPESGLTSYIMCKNCGARGPLVPAMAGEDPTKTKYRATYLWNRPWESQ